MIRCWLLVVLATIPLSQKWESCVKSWTCSSGSLNRGSSGLIQSPASTRGGELTAELWLFVLYDDQEIRLFHSTITADLCLARLRDRTEAENKVGFCMKSGTKNMRSHCKFPELLWQHILLFNKLDGLARNPAFNASPHLGGQISTKGDLPSDQQSFLDNPVIPPCLCAWDVIRNPGLCQPNLRGRKKTWKGRLSRGGKNFFSFFFKKKPSAHHPSFCRKRPRAQIPSSSLRRIRLCQTGSSFHPRAASRTLKKCALWIPASDFAVPAGTFWGKLLLRTHKTSSTMAGGSMLWQWSIMSLEKQIPSFKVDPWRWADALISTSGSSLHPFTCGDIHWRKPTLWDFASTFYFGVAFEYPIGKVRYVSQF